MCLKCKVGTTDQYAVWTCTQKPTPKLEATTKRITHETLDEKFYEKVAKNIFPQFSRTAELYGLPKDHKTDIPLRPIVSACDDPVGKLM